MHLNLDPLQLEFIRVYRSPKLIGLEYSSHVVKKHLGGLDTPQGSRFHEQFHLNNAYRLRPEFQTTAHCSTPAKIPKGVHATQAYWL